VSRSKLNQLHNLRRRLMGLPEHTSIPWTKQERIYSTGPKKNEDSFARAI